jgi:hypothetical protein
MEKKKWVTEQKQTFINDRNGIWSSDTFVMVKGFCYVITTSVIIYDQIKSYAIEVTDIGDGSVQYELFNSKKYDLLKTTGSNDEETIKNQHSNALNIFDAMSDKLPTKTEATIVIIKPI